MFKIWFGGDSPEPRREGSASPLTFGEDVRQALGNAREEALELRHPQVGTEHILLGLLRDREYEAVRELGALGVDREKVWRYVKDAAPAGRATPRRSELPYTDGAKRVLEQTMAEAQATGVHE